MRTNFRTKEHRYWHSFFHIKRYGKRDRFTRLVETDGISLCIHFRRPVVRTPLKRKPLNPLDYQQEIKSVGDVIRSNS